MRLATYEDAEETKFLEKIYTRGNGLENTVFAILSPDGKEHLTRAGRKPSYRRASQLANAMDQIVQDGYGDSKQKRWSDTTLPEFKSLDLAINVASCDSLPAIIVIGENDAAIEKSKKQLLPIAWNEELAGQFVFASVKTSEDLRAISGIPEDSPSGVYVVAPGQFGMSSEVVAKVSDFVDTAAATKEISTALANFKPVAKNHRQHVQFGFQLGLKWETAVPVTDREAARAASRLWGTN